MSVLDRDARCRGCRQLRVQVWISFAVLSVIVLFVYAVAIVVSDGTAHAVFSRTECILIVSCAAFNVSCRAYGLHCVRVGELALVALLWLDVDVGEP